MNIAEAKVLVVGAGGIGCELLKCLVMSGFKRISIADMDTIEKSNLNRQFLFNESTIGKYKSQMAVKSMDEFRQDPSLQLKSFIGNIKDKILFPEEFFKQFNIILNALDNIDARHYINLICMRNGIPLVNSGSEGYLGGVGCHIRGKTPCYNCNSKNKQKTIPICSIRLHPQKIEHCVAWGKALFERLFNPSTNVNADYVADNPIEKGDILKTLRQLYFEDINSLENTRAQSIDIDWLITKYESIEEFEEASDKLYEQWAIEDYMKEDETKQTVMSYLNILYIAYHKLLKEEITLFDKENDTIINFIYASSNLRAFIFYIPQESKFKIKEIAGNIIPAISSTNSIVASIQVIESMKMIKGVMEYVKNVSLNMNRRIVSSTSMKEEINPNCMACSEKQTKKSMMKIKEISIDMTTTTLGMFIEEYCMKELQIQSPMIEVNSLILYESSNNLDEYEVEDYEKLKTQLLSSFIFYEEMTTKANKIEVSIYESGNDDNDSDELKAIYQLKQLNSIKRQSSENKDMNQDYSLLGKKRKMSLE